MADDAAHHDNAALTSPLAQAESQRDGWRAAGQQEQHREACCPVAALELQLDQKLQQGMRRSQG